MIRLTRLNGRPIVVNAEVVESLESTPDTLICFINGNKLAVRETVDSVVAKVLEYRQRISHQQPDTNRGNLAPQLETGQ